MNKNIRFLSSLLVLCGFCAVDVHAAPSVKMLGTNTARIGTNATVVKSNDNNASTQRLGSIRSKTVNAGSTVNVNKVVSPSINKVTTSSAATDSDSRLSLGKYIHSTGVSTGAIKPVTTGSSNAGISSSDFIALSDQVNDLKNTKQDTISVGDGLVLDGNTISLDSSALQSQVAEGVAVALGSDYYTADEIDTMLEENVLTPPTYTSATQENVEYESINIADSFDSGFKFTE